MNINEDYHHYSDFPSWEILRDLTNAKVGPDELLSCWKSDVGIDFDYGDAKKIWKSWYYNAV